MTIHEQDRQKKGKEVNLYSAYRQYNSTTMRSDVDHTDEAVELLQVR